MQFAEDAQIVGTRVREDGYLVADTRVARTGIQLYLGSEVGRPDLTTVRVFRPADEVFSSDAMASFAHRPVTDDHPKEAVTADNWKKLAVGQTADEVKRDGDFLRVPLMVADGAAVKKVTGGKRQLSAGYTCDLVWQDGTAPNGETYDAIQTNIRANHVAIVDRGRAGPDCRIGDSAELPWWASPINDQETKNMGTRTVMVDGLSVETTDQGAQAIDKLVADRAELQLKLDTANAEHQKALAAKDAEHQKTVAALDAANAKIVDGAALSKLVADRVALEGVALKLAKDVKPAGLTDAELKVAVLKAHDASIPADKLANAAYVDARFDILASDASAQKPDGFRDALRSTPSSAHATSAEQARQQAFDAMCYFDQFGTEMKVN